MAKGKVLTDASYKERDKKKEVADFKAGKRTNPGYLDLTPAKSAPKQGSGKSTVTAAKKAEDKEPETKEETK